MPEGLQHQVDKTGDDKTQNTAFPMHLFTLVVDFTWALLLFDHCSSRAHDFEVVLKGAV